MRNVVKFGLSHLPESPMFRTLIVLLALTLAISPVLLAVEPATEFPASWSCHLSPLPNGDTPCYTLCDHYDGSFTDREYMWDCPDSDFRRACTNRPCDTEESCRKDGLPYVPCHDREDFVCSLKARRETRLTCPVKGPPGSAIKVGDCVIRIVKVLIIDKVMLRRTCFDVPYDQYAHDSWRPANPEELKRWYYTQGNTGPAYPTPPPPPVDLCALPNPDPRFNCP